METFFYYFILFIFYSFCGWCIEEVVCSIAAKKIANRGFLIGPYCPIYGYASIFMILLLNRYNDDMFALFIMSAVLCTVLEYLTSLAMEKLFHARWWDYSNRKFNINGRVCLLNSLLFGVMSLIAVHFVHPVFDRALRKLSDSAANIAASALLCVFIVDLLDSVKSLVSFSAYLARLKEFTEGLKEHYEREAWFAGSSAWEWIESAYAHAKSNSNAFNDSLRAKLEKFHTHHDRIDYLVKKFPSIRSTHYGTQLEALRTRIEKNIQSRRANRETRRNSGR